MKEAGYDRVGGDQRTLPVDARTQVEAAHRPGWELAAGSTDNEPSTLARHDPTDTTTDGKDQPCA